MRIYKTSDYNEMSRKAAHIIAAQVTLKGQSVLGLATGSSPVGTYKRLIELNSNKDLNFSEVFTVNLDEYKGLTPEHEQSYRYFMNDNFFNHINIKAENTHVPDGMAENPELECKRYEELICSLGGIDLQLLGIGHNGHIGFNEPGADFVPCTHCISLTESTIEANKRFFDDVEQVPREAYTMGIKAIMQARCVLMVISGKEKALIAKESFLGPITPQVPASILQLHNNFILVGDEAALSWL